MGMTPPEPDPALEGIPEPECLEIPGQHSLGRVAIVVDGQPLIFPVNYALGGGIIVLRTGPGTKLTHGPTSNVCFEIDGDDSSARAGWSAIVQGVAIDATSFDHVSWAARMAEPQPAAPGARPLSDRHRAHSDHRTSVQVKG
jgi:uncharacterized protein